MEELNVLSIAYWPGTRWPKRALFLKNLQTLVIQWCESLKSISVVGELVNLKILICRWCAIESLPMEIGRLSGLKLLELSNCRKLKTIPPGIISKLKELEELIVWECFDRWEAKNALRSELEHLSCLRRLEIAIKDPGLAAEQICLPSNLIDYHIRIGDSLMDWDEMEYLSDVCMLCKSKMELFLPENICLAEWIRELVRSVEYMDIEGDGSSLDFGVAHNMQVLAFKKCSTLKTLVSSTTSDPVFPLLKILYLEELGELKEICDIDGPPIPSSSFDNLQGIKRIGFPVLEEMKVTNCKRLKSFVCTTSPDDGDIRIPCKQQKFEFGSLRKLNVGGYIGSMCRNWCPMMTGILTRLSELQVNGISGMKSLFPYSVAQNLHNLRDLYIEGCNDMVGVIEDDACSGSGETPPTPTHLLPKLEYIVLFDLQKLKSFCECKRAHEFPSLASLCIGDCELMEEFTSGHLLTPVLEHIEIGFQRCSGTNVNALLKQRRRKIEVENDEEVIKHLDSIVQKWRKRHAELSIGINKESQSEKRRRIEMEVEMAHHNTHFTQGESSVAPERRRQLLEFMNDRD